jgi:enamine deaminase RidA (YjgF/YER057c/UK114 family)
MSESPHTLVNPETLGPPAGFSHAVVAAPGRFVFLGGQTAHGPDGRLRGATLVEQFEETCHSVVRALDAVGARPEHLVQILIYVTDAEDYRRNLGPIGAAWRGAFGHHYPAAGLFEVAGLFDPGAKVELVCVAVVPEEAP